MKTILKYIILNLILVATYSCSNELTTIVEQSIALENKRAIRLSVLPTLNNATRAATDAADWEKNIESLELYYFSQSDKECFYIQRVKINADGQFGLEDDNANATDIPVAEGVFTAAQRNGKYAQFTILAIANYETDLLSDESVDANSYYEAWPIAEPSVGRTYQYLKEELSANVMKKLENGYRAGIKGETIAMIAEGNFSLMKGTDVIIGDESYYQLGSLELKRICPKIAVRLISRSGAAFNVKSVQFINVIDEMSLFDSSSKGHTIDNLINTNWMDVSNNSIQNIDGVNYYVFYINENYQESITICPQETRTYVKMRVQVGDRTIDYSVLANNSEEADGHFLKRNKVYLTTVLIP